MRIVKQPDVAAWRSEVTCRQCKAVLEVELADLTYKKETEPHDMREPGGCGFSITCQCPVCKQHVYVQVPPELHHAIKQDGGWRR